MLLQNSTRRWLRLACWCAVAFVPSARAARVDEVIVVCKTHFDIGYTDLARNVLESYRTTMIDKALGTVDATRDLPAEQQFAWTIPGWPLTQILWPGQEPGRRQRIEDAIRSGRFVWHALPVTSTRNRSSWRTSCAEWASRRDWPARTVSPCRATRR